MKTKTVRLYLLALNSQFGSIMLFTQFCGHIALWSLFWQLWNWPRNPC